MNTTSKLPKKNPQTRYAFKGQKNQFFDTPTTGSDPTSLSTLTSTHIFKK